MKQLTTIPFIPGLSTPDRPRDPKAACGLLWVLVVNSVISRPLGAWRARSTPLHIWKLVPNHGKTALKQAAGWQSCNFSWEELSASFSTRLPTQPDHPFCNRSQEGSLEQVACVHNCSVFA